MGHEALTLFPRRIGKIKEMESENGSIIHCIVLGEGEEEVSFILSEDTHPNNTSVDKNWPRAWPVVPV